MKSRVTQGYSSRPSPTGRSRARAGLLALAAGTAVAFGSYAALGRLDIGPDEQQVELASNESLARRAAQLDAMEADLQAVLAKAPPKLPPIPKYPPVKKPRVSKPRVITVSYVQDVKYEKDKKGKKGKYKNHKAEERKREAEKKRAEQKREAERKRAEQKREAEKKKREEQRKGN